MGVHRDHGLAAATAVLVAPTSPIAHEARGGGLRAAAGAPKRYATWPLATTPGSCGQAGSGGTEDTAAWLGVDPTTWRTWQRLAAGAGWLTHDGRGWTLRDTAALEGSAAADPGAFFGAALRLTGANFGPAPFMDSPLQSPYPHSPEPLTKAPDRA